MPADIESETEAEKDVQRVGTIEKDVEILRERETEREIMGET